MVYRLKYYLIGLCVVLSACGQPDFRVEDNRVYIVRPGDSLYNIGQMYGLHYRDLALRNHIPPPYRIYVGQRIYLTGKSPEKYTYYHKNYAHADQAKPTRNTGVWLWPLRGQISSTFGKRNGRHHDGLDILAKKGTAIRAAQAGEVAFIGQQRGYGNLILLRHKGDMYTAYAHNDKNLVKKGYHVRAGDVIALVGKTGNASTAHLHFEVRFGAKAVNPMSYLPKL